MKNKQEQERFDAVYQSVTVNNKLMYPGRILQRSAQRFPNRAALIFHGAKITFKELYDRTCAFSQLLRKKGVKRSDRVLICFENVPEFYVAYYAVWQAGAVVVPLNTFLKEKELAHIVFDAKPKLIITASDRVHTFQDTDIADLPEVITEQDFPSDYSKNPADDIIDLDPKEMVALLYTSGTTGVPKGVMLSGKNIVTNMVQINARIGFVGQERVFGVLPLFHSFAQNTCVWTSFFIGVTVILVPKIERKYILEGLQEKPTYFLGVPALYGLLCLLKTAPVDSVTLFISGGDALPDKIRSIFGLLYRRKICNGYGLTETAPALSVEMDDEVGPTSCVGYPLIGVEFAVRDEKGNDLPQGAIGELWAKGDMVMMGYYNDLEQTEKVIKAGWFDTGDLGYIDPKGKIVITGREKDLIIHKGFNIYPQEIENIILSHSNVLRVGVIGKKEDASGEIPIAYVQLRSKQENAAKELKALCKQYLASYKIPREFICDTKDLPTTATGKVDKKILRRKMQGENR